MVDFDKLRTQKKKPKVIEPTEIFRRLPKPPGINDLYTSQAEVLNAWFLRRMEKDVVVKLHTGGGKTLVGLLMAQSTCCIPDAHCSTRKANLRKSEGAWDSCGPIRAWTTVER